MNTKRICICVVLCFGLAAFSGASKPETEVDLTASDVVQTPVVQTPATHLAAQQEIRQITSRTNTREQQLRRAIHLYAVLKKQSVLYTYKNQFKTDYMLQNSISITRDIFIDQLADQNRLDVLGNK